MIAHPAVGSLEIIDFYISLGLCKVDGHDKYVTTSVVLCIYF